MPESVANKLIDETEEIFNKFNMDAEVVVSTGDTFDDYAEMDISWGGPNSSDGNSKIDAEYIYINNFITEKKEFKYLHKS